MDIENKYTMRFDFIVKKAKDNLGEDAVLIGKDALVAVSAQSAVQASVAVMMIHSVPEEKLGPEINQMITKRLDDFERITDALIQSKLN